MEKTKKILNRIFIDGLSGMALGLFSTLIIGTIIAQIGTLIGGPVGSYLKAISNVAKTLTGAGIGVGVACKFKEGPLVTVSAAVAGMIGAFPAAPEAILPDLQQVPQLSDAAVRWLDLQLPATARTR